MIEEQLNKLIAEFEHAQYDYSNFGAQDTEPDWNFQNALRVAFRDKKRAVPNSAMEWELFSSMGGVDKVAADMSRKTNHIVDLILKVDEDHDDYMKVRKLLRDYCHRVDL